MHMYVHKLYAYFVVAMQEGIVQSRMRQFGEQNSPTYVCKHRHWPKRQI